jgi:uncharacterized membrane protein YfcA
MPWEWPVGAAAAFFIALVTTPAGVSGAVLLLPFQLGVLGVPSPAVTPTNLLYNVASTPGGLYRFWRERRLLGPLSTILLAGTLPGVIAGAVIRVEFLDRANIFDLLVAGVLLPLGLWLILGASRTPQRPRAGVSRRARGWTWLLALFVGTVGGIYGIGGGSLLAPLLLVAGYSAYEVAPATLSATFVTSACGVVTFQVLQSMHTGAIAPEWGLGVWLGVGGFLGSYCGAGLQRRIPEAGLRRLLGVIACVIAVRFLQLGVHHSGSASAANPAAIA